MALVRLFGIGNSPIQSLYSLALAGSGVSGVGSRAIDAIEAPVVHQLGGNITVGTNDTGQCGVRGNASPLRTMGMQSWFPYPITKVVGRGTTYYWLDTTGTVWASGGSGNGQIGTGVFATTYAPVASFVGAKAMSGNDQNAALIDKDGYIWTCGYNFRGRTGLGLADTVTTSTGTWTKTDTGTTKFKAISTSPTHTIAIAEDDTAWGFGEGTSGAFGQGNQNHLISPTQLSTKTWKKIVCGTSYSIGIDTNDLLWIWGAGTNYALGNNSTSNILTWVTATGFIGTAVDVSCGTNHTAVIDSNGEIWVAGLNQFGKTGMNTTTGNTQTFTKLNTGATRFTQIQCGKSETYALSTDGKIWGAGYAGAYQMDQQNTTNLLVFTVGTNPWTWSDLGEGNGGGGLIAKRNNGVWYYIGAYNGSAGTGNSGSHFRNYTPVTYISGKQANLSTQCQALGFIDDENYFYGWANNSVYQLGFSDSTVGYMPRILTYTKYKYVALGQQHGFVIDLNDKLYTAGSNTNYKTGLNTATGNTTSWTQVGTDSWKMVSASSQQFTMAIRSDDTLWGWGAASSYQLGNGSTTTVQVPTQIGTETWLKVSTGGAQTLAIRSDGTLWAWGGNSNYLTGRNTSSGNTVSPTQIAVGTTFTDVSVGTSSVLAIDSTGRLWSWGQNTNGECGTGNSTAVGTPTVVASLNGTVTFKECYAGSTAGYALSTDDKLYSCGSGATYSTLLGTSNTVYTFTKVSDNHMAVVGVMGTVPIVKCV